MGTWPILAISNFAFAACERALMNQILAELQLFKTPNGPAENIVEINIQQRRCKSVSFPLLCNFLGEFQVLFSHDNRAS